MSSKELKDLYLSCFLIHLYLDASSAKGIGAREISLHFPIQHLCGWIIECLGHYHLALPSSHMECISYDLTHFYSEKGMFRIAFWKYHPVSYIQIFGLGDQGIVEVWFHKIGIIPLLPPETTLNYLWDVFDCQLQDLLLDFFTGPDRCIASHEGMTARMGSCIPQTQPRITKR